MMLRRTEDVIDSLKSYLRKNNSDCFKEYPIGNYALEMIRPKSE